MPKPGKGRQREPPLPSQTLVIDNGAYTLKAGFSPQDALSDAETLAHCHVVPNALARTRDKRTYIASQLDTRISDWTDAIFRRPVEKGQVVSWEAQKAIWDHTFFGEKTAAKDLLVQDVNDTTLVLTETPNTLPSLQKNADEIVMEEWGFGAYSRVIGPCLNAFNDVHPLMGDPAADQEHIVQAVECILVVDSGYSHTTVTPVYNARPIQRAIRRLDFGGKHLTNMLKEIVSTRHYDLHQDTNLVNDIKEQTSFVSMAFTDDIERTWKGNLGKSKSSQAPPTPPEADAMDVDEKTEARKEPAFVDYVLPDGVHIKRGFTRPHDPSQSSRKRKFGLDPTSPRGDEVAMTLGNERFTVPEIIFSPSDIGSKQAGLPELVMQSLSTLPPAVQATMLANILVVGGNATIPGFVERLQNDIRMLARVEYEVRVRSLNDPVASTWLGGARMARNKDILKSMVITKQQYQEYGSVWAGRKLASAGPS